MLLLQDVFVSFITDPQQQATPGQPGEIHTDTVPEFDIIAMMSVPNSNYKRVEIIDDLKDFLKDLDLNNVRCLWMDGHSDQNGQPEHQEWAEGASRGSPSGPYGRNGILWALQAVLRAYSHRLWLLLQSRHHREAEQASRYW